MKRSFDILFSIIGIALLLPLWIIISLIILIESRGPILFKQKRVGKNKKIFFIFKFRSMVVNHISPLSLGPIKHDHPLVTRIGFLLRRTKLDETPQLINILIGEMSLVGPRPCLPERLKTMSAYENQRFDILPGLSGWAEINGNVELSFSEQVLLDVWYVYHETLFLYFFIIFKSMSVVIRGSIRNETALSAAKLTFSNHKKKDNHAYFSDCSSP